MNDSSIPSASCRPRSRLARALSFLLVSAVAAPVPHAAAQQRSATVERASASRAKGADGAAVLVYEIADFECPHCARFALDVFPSIDSAFVKTGKVQWVFVNLPVPTHPTSWLAHEAALCAGAVAGKFWEMHDRIFGAQEQWIKAADPTGSIDRFARELGVPSAEFSECTRTDAVAPLLLQDVFFAMAAQVSGTPAFIVNNEQSVMGLKTFEEWKTILEPMIRAKSGK